MDWYCLFRVCWNEHRLGLSILNKNKMTRKYTKRNREYWYGYHTFEPLGYLVLILLAIMMLVAWIWREQKLISPIPDVIPQVHAYDVVIPCEKGVAEFLECKAVAGEITYKEAEIMLAIAKAESNLKERAANRHSTARGVFQIIASTWYLYDCVGDKYFWKDNTICAIKIMKQSGYTPWEVYNTGSYLKYL